MVSVITVVLNSRDLMKRTIDSIKAQTSKNFEYIVIDGGSSDGTLDIIKNNLQYIDYWSSNPDEGISDAFNKGINRSSGEVIGVLNAGDLFEPTTIEIVDKSFSDDIFYIYGNSIIRKETGEFDKVISPRNIAGFPYGGMPFQHSSLFIRKLVYDKIGGFNLNYKTAMDFELLLRIYNADFKGVYIDHELSIYYRGGVSDRNYIGGYIEVLKASIRYDNNYFKIFFYFLYGVVKTSARRLMS